MQHTPREQRLAALRDELVALRDDALAQADAAASRIAAVHDVHRASAANLIHYLAVRAHELRGLQQRLSAEGLSSLGRMESGVVRNLSAVIRILDDALADGGGGRPVPTPRHDALAVNAAALLGGTPGDRNTRIMVTLPTEAATDAALVSSFARAGMDVARVNCAHDDPDAWARMAAHVRAAGDGIPVAFDLAGPKLRTGPIEAGPCVVRVKPARDDLGRVTAPARLWLGRAPVGSDGDIEIPVRDDGWLRERSVGDVVSFTDARGRRRRMLVAETTTSGVLLQGDRTAYLLAGMPLEAGDRATPVGDVPALEQALRVHVGDEVVLTSSLRPASPSRDGRHMIGCTLPEAFRAARPGQRAAFDDGKIMGVITEVVAGTDDGADGGSDARITVEVTRASPTGTKLRAEKGINLPDTRLPVSALTAEDLDALDHVVPYADIVQASFVRTVADVRRIIAALDERGGDDLGIVVKVEAVAGFTALPDILLELMRRPRVGVMIARGDLAVEAGFERLAEMQEEILWLCEAAHIPVIWATQVLDTLADRGVPTRAEVTDAAAGERAECVMLNKGPHIVEAIHALDDILRRMRGHIDKKRSLLRRLGAWDARG